MGRELELDWLARRLARQLLNLTGVAMAHHAIGGNCLGGLGQEQVFLGGAAAAAGACFGIDHDAAGLDEPLLQEGQQG